MRTMNDRYKDSSSHECCPVCEYCKTCGDCECAGPATAVEQLRAELAACREGEARMRGIGGQLSNVAFNLAQRAGHVISSDDCSLLDGLRKQWDAELAASREREAGRDALIDCRTCRNYTRDGCIQTAQCVNGDGYRRATTVRFWSAALAEGAKG